MIWKKFLYYLNFFGAKREGASNFNLKVMHGINRISILMFLAAIIIMIVRHLF